MRPERNALKTALARGVHVQGCLDVALGHKIDSPFHHKLGYALFRRSG